jgi:hypothetical protein
MSTDPLVELAKVRPLALTFRRAKTDEAQFLARFDSYKYGQALRAAMRPRPQLPGAKA